MTSTARLDALRTSVAHLRELVTRLDDRLLTTQAYPAAWTISDVLSHIGSAAVIMQRRLDDSLADHATPDEFAREVWATWDAKAPRVQADDALVADRRLLDRIESLTEDERADFRFSMGPLQVDFDGMIGLRLNEHVLHTWDIEVVLDPAATLPLDATAQLIDNLGLVARYTAKPIGTDGIIVVATTAPARVFRIRLAVDAVEFTAAGPGDEPTLELPAEAFARLVYGRLDADRRVPVTGDAGALDELRLVFPGP